jgi:hypothetical protein
MYARAVDEYAVRIRELRSTERDHLVLGAVALALAVGSTQVWPELALPLFLGGFFVLVTGMRALWRRWDLVDQLAGERDAYVISEVRAYGAREAAMERRRILAASIRHRLTWPGLDVDGRLTASAGQLEALAAELEDDSLALDPVCATACKRLLFDATDSPLLNVGIPAQDVASQISRIRAGFTRIAPDG